jgi:serine/threonine-protein kinase
MGTTAFITAVTARVAAVLAAAMFIAAAALPAHAATKPKKSAYGAIAYEPGRRTTGYSHDFKSDREARLEALRQCGEPACEVLVSFRNACGALARGPVKPFAATGVTRAEAETKALRRCGHKACEVVAWACTK